VPSAPSCVSLTLSWRAWTTFAILCVIWGIPYFLIKLALVDFSPAVIAWSRITLGALVLVPIAWKRGVLKPALAHKGAIAAFAIGELVVPFSLIALGEQWISSSLTGILIATVPLSVVVIAPLFGVKERLGLVRVAGLAIGFFGVVSILGLDTGHGPQLWAGVACMIVAVAGYAIGPLIVERYLADVDEMGALSAPQAMPAPLSLTSVVVLGIVCTALALLLYFYLINEAGAARASVVAYVNPAVAAVLGVWILDEPFGIGTGLGMAMILFGSWLATNKPQREADAVTEA
jgi:drug/metabolite transporter (DMT)-like permease